MSVTNIKTSNTKISRKNTGQAGCAIQMHPYASLLYKYCKYTGKSAKEMKQNIRKYSHIQITF